MGMKQHKWWAVLQKHIDNKVNQLKGMVLAPKPKKLDGIYDEDELRRRQIQCYEQMLNIEQIVKIDVEWAVTPTYDL